MKKTLFILIILICCLVSDLSAISTKSESLQKAATANGNGTAVDIQGYSTAVIQVSGTFAATISFKASVDKTNYSAIQCFSIADRTSTVTTVTVPGVWRCNLVGLASFRAEISGYASGSITVNGMFNSAGVF